MFSLIIVSGLSYGDNALERYFIVVALRSTVFRSARAMPTIGVSQLSTVSYWIYTTFNSLLKVH
jgi:hypothetical protein